MSEVRRIQYTAQCASACAYRLCGYHGAGVGVWGVTVWSTSLQGHMQGAGIRLELPVRPQHIHLPDREQSSHTESPPSLSFPPSLPPYLNHVRWTVGSLGELEQLEPAPLANVALWGEEGPGYLVPGGEVGGGKIQQLKENEKVLPR